MTFSNEANQTKAPFILPDLPYGKSDLEPHMSAETFDYHHGKHHNAYVTNLNNMLKNFDDFEGQDLEGIIKESYEDSAYAGIFNNAAQIWNHSFFWHSMRKNGGGMPQERLLNMINNDFGSFEKFCEEFVMAGATQFGSGWVWLVSDIGTLKIIKTSNAETPITNGHQPLICCDVWEHAYYIDYKNARPDFLKVFLEKLVNWEFAETNLDA